MTGRDGGAGPRRRGLVDEVAAELRAIRRDVDDTSRLLRETTGLVAEALPRVDDLERGLARVQGTLDGLTSGGEAVDPEAEAAGVALGLGAYPQGPWCWPLMDRDEAEAAWDQLARFTGEILCEQYNLTRGQVIDCWPVHARAVNELSWLRLAFRAAYMKGAPPNLAADWHARSLATALSGIAASVDADECVPGWHRVPARTREAARGGRVTVPVADPSDTSAGRPRHFPETLTGSRPGSEPSSPAMWMPYVVDARTEDIGGRPAVVGPTDHGGR